MATTEGMTRSGQLRGVSWLGLVAAATAVLALTVGLAQPAVAATRFVATSGTDSGNTCLASGAPCKTITRALSQAVANDTISVAAGTYNLALGETFPLTINMNLTLTGAGAGSTILDATGANQRVITISAGTVTIAGVTITGGAVSCSASGSVFCDTGGGGMFGFNSSLTLTDSTVSGNSASCTNSGSGGCQAFGGGLRNSGALTLTNSTVSGNSASCTDIGTNECDAVGGGLHNDGMLTLTNSTVSGNSASCTNSGTHECYAVGGGLNNGVPGGPPSTLTLTNSTVSKNSASCTNSGSGDCAAVGGGLVNIDTVTITSATVTANTVTCTGICFAEGGGLGNAAGTTTLQNTIVAKQDTGSDCANFSTLTSNGFNLDSDNTCHLTQPSDKPNVTDPLLGPLQNNGGPTQTHALLPGSPAIDGGTNSGCPATDQRGVARPQGLACDIGAFELASISSPGPTGTANARQILNVATFAGPTVPPTPQQQQQTFLATDPILAGATYYDPNPACVGVPPAGVKLFVFTLEGQLILGKNRDAGSPPTNTVTNTQIGTSKYQALLATLDPGALAPGVYNLVFWVKDCTNTDILVSEFAALRVLAP